jgi:hypothetical protein
LTFANSKIGKLGFTLLHLEIFNGVKMEGEKFNFNAVLLSPENDNWVLDLKKTLLNLNTKQHFPPKEYL